ASGPRSGLAQRELEPAVRDVVCEREALRVLPHEAHELRTTAAEQVDGVAALPARGDARHVAHEPDTADDRRRRDRRAAGLVVQRDVAGHDGDPELAGGLRDAVDRTRELPADLRL